MMLGGSRSTAACEREINDIQCTCGRRCLLVPQSRNTASLCVLFCPECVFSPLRTGRK